jgi:hypothetical protein
LEPQSLITLYYGIWIFLYANLILSERERDYQREGGGAAAFTPTEYTECWPFPLFDILLNTVSISLLASLVAGRRLLVQNSRECTPPYLSTGISNLLQPAQLEVVLGQLSTYLASWFTPPTPHPKASFY